MSFNWRILPLGEVLDLVIDHRGKTPKKLGFEGFYETGYPVLSAKHVKTGGLVNTDSIRRANKAMYEKWMKVPVKKGDIVLTSEAPMGEVYYIDGSVEYVLGQRVFGLRPNKDVVDPMYLAAWLASDAGQSALRERATGSTVQGIKQAELLKIKVDIPPLVIQKGISDTYSIFSSKIQLNHHMNQTLEKMAQAIFKSWFVDFEPVKAKIAARERWQAHQSAQQPASPVCYAAELEPESVDPELETRMALAAMQAISGKTEAQLARLQTEHPEYYAELRATADLFPAAMQESEVGEIPAGWSCLALDEIAKYKNGLALQKYRPENEDDFLPVVKIAQLKKGYADGEEKASPNINPECIIDDGDVLFSWSGSLMVDTWCGGRAALNQHLFKVTSEKYPKWLYFHFTRHHLEEFQRIAADKAVTMGHIKREHLKRALCAIPDSDTIAAAGKSLGSMLQQQINLRLEAVTLSQLRDTLLPELLSGEFTVPQSESTATEAVDA